MGQERLSNLALLHIERDYANKVMNEDMDKMIDAFGASNGRHNTSSSSKITSDK